jgi:hypothetical protein
VERVYTKPRLDKLGVRPGCRVAIVGLADPDFRDELLERTTDLTEGQPLPRSDLVFLAAESPDDLAGLAELRARLKPEGAVWVVSRKGGAATLRYADVLGAALDAGLVDNKVVSFSESHTALRLVIPRALRPH